MIRALLVDDEAPARNRLRAMLAEHDDVQVVGEAQDGAEALALIAERRPDLILLDIQMPGLTGMQVAAGLAPPRPRIIFCTAYDQFAVDAFEQNAVDYLLKPLSRPRLARALERMRGALAEEEKLHGEVREATRAQARLLPQALPALEGLEIAGHCHAARGVGGDFYDFLPLGHRRLGIVIADVSGKGLFAGILMASLQARVQSLAPSMGNRVAPLLGTINQLLHGTTESNRYATMFYATYDDATRELCYVNAGHNPPLLRRVAGPDGARRTEFCCLETGGPAVGMLPDARYRQATVRLATGDLLVLFSDGVTEATDGAGREFGVRRLQRCIERNADLPAASLLDRLTQEVENHRGGSEQNDDLTLVVAKAVGGADADSAGR